MPRKDKTNDEEANFTGTLMDSVFRLSDCLLSTHPDTPRTGTVPEMMDAAVEEIIILRTGNKRLVNQLSIMTDALECVCKQFGVWNESVGGVGTGGMGDLEYAFTALGWDDPRHVPEMCCDEPGCTRQATNGFPTPNGYRRTCGRHYVETPDAAADTDVGSKKEEEK